MVARSTVARAMVVMSLSTPYRPPSTPAPLLLCFILVHGAAAAAAAVYKNREKKERGGRGAWQSFP